MREIGEVIGIEKGYAKVRIKRTEACARCGACNMGQAKSIDFLAKNMASAKIGDKVEIETQTNNVLKASFIMYGIPLLFFLIGTLLAYFIANQLGMIQWNNLISFIAGIIWTLVSYLLIKKNENKFSQDTGYQAVINKIIRS
ncbi:SoxR reducing system RseC family protein [Garciella nitratireducens]|uniref:SoxR reducing system RseC family protein n=1 Tax=Garciella nitratireducens TaxID=218205 RepID=UPI000DEAE7C2|nr:SoxR reducing system RseC family protein [Garciella nitratireducens]RBP39211.1 RseC/MucC-like positive regulator of sigma(E) [Garciella nitratireducens]